VSEQQPEPEHGDPPAAGTPDETPDDTPDDTAVEPRTGTGSDEAAGSVGRTGHPVVDDVVASLAGLEDRPVAEHVEVFESAHDRLRGALADAGDDSSA
jgi:hypothetical protein